MQRRPYSAPSTRSSGPFSTTARAAKCASMAVGGSTRPWTAVEHGCGVRRQPRGVAGPVARAGGARAAARQVRRHAHRPRRRRRRVLRSGTCLSTSRRPVGGRVRPRGTPRWRCRSTTEATCPPTCTGSSSSRAWCPRVSPCRMRAPPRVRSTRAERPDLSCAAARSADWRAVGRARAEWCSSASF